MQLQDQEILKIMIKEQYVTTKKMQVAFFLIYFFGYMIPLNMQMNYSDEKDTSNWGKALVCLNVCLFVQIFMLLQEVLQYLKMSDTYMDSWMNVLDLI